MTHSPLVPHAAAAHRLARRIADRASGAIFSRDGKYRYLLWRRWRDDHGLMLFVGLNPSTADAINDDPTIRRCIGFARRHGVGGILVANLFAFRATKVRDLRAARAPVGPGTDRWLRAAVRIATTRVACWGAHGALLDRAQSVRALLGPARCFGMTRGGEPRHPLYLRRDAALVAFRPARQCAQRDHAGDGRLLSAGRAAAAGAAPDGGASRARPRNPTRPPQ